jgi:hypothetical protein
MQVPKQIKLKAHNIFTGNLNAGSDIAPGTPLPPPPGGWICANSDVGIDDYCSGFIIHDPAGSISLDATQYLRTENIDASSQSGNGGNVTIQASDAIVGSIDTSGSTDIVHAKYYDWYGNLVDYSYSFNGGDVSVKTDTFKVGTISTDGGRKKGTVAIETSNLPTDVTGQGGTGIVLPPVDEIAKPSVIQQRVLVFIEAQRLAGQKLTAQEIANQLNLSLDIAQIAVLIPIGDSIKVSTPDLSELYNGSLYAGDGDGLDPCGWPCKVIWGAGELSSWALKQLIKHILQSKSESKDSGDENEDNRNWRQDKELTEDEVERLENGGEDVHELKGSKNASKRDLYKDKKGNIYVKPKGGRGPGSPTDLNINDF